MGDHLCYWCLGNTPFERQLRHRALWHEGLDPNQFVQIRQHVYSDWLLGGEASLTTLVRTEGRRVASLPKGRPPYQTTMVEAKDSVRIG